MHELTNSAIAIKNYKNPEPEFNNETLHDSPLIVTKSDSGISKDMHSIPTRPNRIMPKKQNASIRKVSPSKQVYQVQRLPELSGLKGNMLPSYVRRKNV